MKPIVIVNFKTYLEATGERALRLARVCAKLSEESDVPIVAAPQHMDLYMVAHTARAFAQHMDPIEPGSHTGWVLPMAVKEAGAVGTLINHSERRLTLADIGACVSIAKRLGLDSVVCTNNVDITRAAAALEPTYVAVEPPELIGSGVAVSKADPEVVAGSVDAAKKVSPRVGVLCGAGITTADDLSAALELGAEGVLLASGIVKAPDQEEALRRLISKL
ncbi:MAG: triose-phosphate isomerase [Methermicoccaceae archaeon]